MGALTMFRFGFPWGLVLLFLPLLLPRFIPFKERKEEFLTLRFADCKRLKKCFSDFSSSINKNRLFFWALFSVWTLLVLALMQPEKVDQITHINSEGYDLMLAVDISPSMNALDFSTDQRAVTRLDVTKKVVQEFVQGRLGDRVGLITFGENAFLHVPLTLDTLSVSQMLDDTVVGMAGRATAIGDAIGLAVKTLRTRPEKSRVLILLTDGVDNASRIPPKEAVKLAKQYGIRIYTIGVGKKGPVPFPSHFGGYQMVEVPIDEKMLQEIAKETNGHYFLATDEKSLQGVYEKINQLEKSCANAKHFWITEPLYHYPLGLAMGILSILVFVPFLRRLV